jgi:hypothetical protein
MAAACARALAAISWSNDDVKRKARDALAPEALRLALETFPHEEAVQKWANRALSKIVDTAVEEMFAGLLADMPEGARA